MNQFYNFFFYPKRYLIVDSLTHSKLKQSCQMAELLPTTERSYGNISNSSSNIKNAKELMKGKQMHEALLYAPSV